MLPDDVLLEIFGFHADEAVDEVVDEAVDEVVDEAINEAMDKDTSVDRDTIKKSTIEEWITLAHVCRRWRSVIFQSPRRLNLRLLCTPKTPAEDTLEIWPPLPLVVVDLFGVLADNILAALEHNNRVCQIELRCYSGSELEYYTNSAAMQKPFPELTHLRLNMYGYYRSGSTLPDSFLGGNAPRLRSLALDEVAFPGLPKLLLSATHLVKLYLFNIPRSGYVPPEAMATSLSALTNLDHLVLCFEFPRPRPALESRRPYPPPLTRPILPRLTNIQFRGASEYLEEILARIDAPRLDGFHITFFNQIMFDTPQLFQFISRRPALRAPQKGHMVFNSKDIVVKFQSQTSDYDRLSVKILCSASDWQLSSIEQVCTSSLPPLSTLEDLYIFESRKYPPLWQADVENTLWLVVLHPFAAVKNLYLCEKIASHIASALQELVGARTTEELPTLENIFLEGLQPSGSVQEGIEKFLTARQLTGRPIAVSRWDRNPSEFRYPYYFAMPEPWSLTLL